MSRHCWLVQSKRTGKYLGKSENPGPCRASLKGAKRYEVRWIARNVKENGNNPQDERIVKALLDEKDRIVKVVYNKY